MESVTTADEDLEMRNLNGIADRYSSLVAKAEAKAKINFHNALSSSLLAEIASRRKDHIASFNWEECRLGSNLGEGKFSNIYEIRSFRMSSHRHLLIEASEEQLDLGGRYRDTRYALKTLKPKLHRLAETLDQRIKSWPDPSKSKLVRMPKMRDMYIKIRLPSRINKATTVAKEKQLMEDCLSIGRSSSGRGCFGVSSPASYHFSGPEAIGFDADGNMKIFGFGLARFVPEDEGDPSMNACNMSAAGTLGYMVYECLRGGFYNMKADVYSYAIVLWEMLSGQITYSFVRREYQLIDYVGKNRDEILNLL
ncbi:hypothetical protein ACHAWF_015930 [Thalassiosira exigua]